jgi:hypothetical protein
MNEAKRPPGRPRLYEPMLVRFTQTQIDGLDAALERRKKTTGKKLCRNDLVRMAVERWIKEDLRPRTKGEAA